MLLHKETRSIQMAMAQYCRTGEPGSVLPWFDTKMAHYHSLVLNNVHDVLTSAYPLTAELLSDTLWSKLVKEFFAHHKCKAFQVWKIAGEFRSYILQHRKDILHTYYVLDDLLLLEWSEMVLFNAIDKDPKRITGTKRLHSAWYTVNTEYVLLKFSYPVHLQKASTILQGMTGTYHVLAYRHPETGFVGFTAISSLHHLFWQQLHASGSLIQAYKSCAAYSGLPEMVIVKGLEDFIVKYLAVLFLKEG